jgi:hypothetical protein
MAKGADWNDIHRTNPGAVRDALIEPDISFETEEAPTASCGNGHDAAGEPIDEAGAKAPRDVPGEGVSLDDFRAFMETRLYLHAERRNVAGVKRQLANPTNSARR